MKVIEHPELTRIKKSTRVIFCHWHGDELVVIKLGPIYHCAAMTSTSKDGELMDKVLTFLGFATSRGSSTRGGARALIGMISLMEKGYHATMAVDGPKGPRHKAKPGAWALAKHTGAPVIPMGVARSCAFVFNKSWNKTYLPWPFTKVIVTFGAPMYANNIESKTFSEELEKQIFTQRGIAQKLLMSFICLFFISACSSSPVQQNSNFGSGTNSLLESSVHTPLKPKGLMLTGNEPAQITYLYPNSIAQKLGFQVGDVVLKINNRKVSGFLEFEKKLKNSVSPSEIYYKNRRGHFLTKSVVLDNSKNRWGASTQRQRISLIKKTSPFVVFMNRAPFTVFCTVSKNQDKRLLFVNLIIDSDLPKTNLLVPLVVKNKNGALISKSQEKIDALRDGSILISKNFPLPKDLSKGVEVFFSLEKQQFSFVFTQ
ncbi:MAG: DUF374 domain-containing protein [Oligoflexia bacterium]|nr:DUF374 domain-containing protein [Oligoflexia bacterium]